MGMKKNIKTEFKAKIGKPNRPDGNLVIYIPKLEKEVHGLKPGQRVKIRLEVLNVPEPDPDPTDA